MSSTGSHHQELRLPLPVARLWRRSRNAKSAKDRHDNAYFALEASVKLSVAAHGPERPQALARGSLGRWVAALPRLAERHDSEPLRRARTLFAEVLDTGSRGSEGVARGEFLDGLVAYRNRVMGHGAPRERAFYERAAEVLLRSLVDAWERGMFLLRDEELLHVESVEIGSDRSRIARVLDLRGEFPLLLDDAGTRVPPEVAPGRLYLRRGRTWASLHPWLLFEDEAERLYYFNGVGRVAEYLDYGSGQILRGEALAALAPDLRPELDALFARPAEETEPAPAPESGSAAGDTEPFRVLGRLGEGGMGVVELAVQESLGRLVARKSLSELRQVDRTAVQRFSREIRALARCDHPNVVKILASHGEGEEPWYAMEWVDGVDLRRFAAARESGRDVRAALVAAQEAARASWGELAQVLPPAEPPSAALADEDSARVLAAWMRDAARGLQHLHERGIVHRDVSPANLMLAGPEARVVLMDLGLAAVSGATRTLTKDASGALGTLRYLPPESFHRQVGPPAPSGDVYALGAVFYELFAGTPPFAGESEAELVKAILYEDAPLLRRHDPELPADLEAILDRALRKSPDERYADAEALADDLSRFLAGEPVEARPRGPLERAWRRVAQRPSWAAAALLLVVGVALGSSLWPSTDALEVIEGRILERLDSRGEPADEDEARRQAQLESVLALLRSGELDGVLAGDVAAGSRGEGIGAALDGLPPELVAAIEAQLEAGAEFDAARADALLAAPLEPARGRLAASLIRVGEAAAGEGAYDLSARAYEGALAMLDALVDEGATDADRGVVAERLAESRLFGADPAGALRAMERAVELARALDPRGELAARAQLKLARVRELTGDGAGALADVREAIPVLESRFFAHAAPVVAARRAEARILAALGRPDAAAVGLEAVPSAAVASAELRFLAAVYRFEAAAGESAGNTPVAAGAAGLPALPAVSPEGRAAVHAVARRLLDRDELEGARAALDALPDAASAGAGLALLLWEEDLLRAGVLAAQGLRQEATRALTRAEGRLSEGGLAADPRMGETRALREFSDSP